MKTYEVDLTGRLKVTAIVTAESVVRAAEIALNAEMLPGESVDYQQQMQCFDLEGPTVEAVRDIEAGNYDSQLGRYFSRGGGATPAAEGGATTMLPDAIQWDIRRPTLEECEFVGRDVEYAELSLARYDETDTVIEIGVGPESRAAFAKAFETFDWCGAAHVVQGGVYCEVSAHALELGRPRP